MSKSHTPHWKKVERGYYVAVGTPYAVVADGYEPGQHVGASRDFDHHTGQGQYEGFIAGEWAAVRFYNVIESVEQAPNHNDGDNLDWFDTKREAVADIERRLRFDQNWDDAGRRLRCAESPS